MGGGPRTRAQNKKKRYGAGTRSSSAAWTGPDSSWSSPKHQSRATSNRALGDWQDFSDSNAHPQNLPMSMAQAAKNTDRHAMAWGSSKLREQRIVFVSAGNLKQEEIEAAAEGRDTPEEEDQVEETQMVEPTPLTIRGRPTQPPAPQVEHPELRNDLSVEPVPQQDSKRRVSVSSDSSEEQILFAGRRNPAHKTDVKLTPATSNPSTPSPEEKSKESQPSVETYLPTPEITAQDSSTSGLERYENILPPLRAKGKEHRGHARRLKKDEEDALVDDYIANMTFEDPSDDDIAEQARSVETGRRTEHFRFFDGATESKVNLKPKPDIDTSISSAGIDQAIDWDSADLEDFDDFSTTDEEVVEVTQVLRLRTRPSGRQYLVSGAGDSADEPRWVLHDKLTSASAVEEIRIFEEIQVMKIQQTIPDSDDSESDAEDDEDDLIDDIASEEEENDRILKHTSRMTDEQIARALAKQEELGLGGDELLLLDGNVDDDDEQNDMDDDDDEFTGGDAFIPFSAKTQMSSRTTTKRNRRQRDHFPSASAFADALDQDPYGAFDVMDFDRPSLRPKKKGRKSDLPFELGLEDPELVERLRSTWERDREKKTARKRERQAERENALLEASERNQPAVIKAEIRQFLMQEADELELAPMDAPQRAAIHRLAKSLKLVSKSQGKDGHSGGRYTVLSKGPRTPRFTIDTIWEIDNFLDSRKFFQKHVFGGYGSAKSAKFNNPGGSKPRRGGAGTTSGASYMNGEVVGASAPELGADNKGRAMLERMGWSSGMGIGAVGNKGSIEVIKHVVKTTKAGLG